MTSPNPMPNLEYERAPCPQCSAATESSAELTCTATQGMDGDYHCAATDCKVDSDGCFMFPTAASLQRLDNWYEADAKRFEMDIPYGDGETGSKEQK